MPGGTFDIYFGNAVVLHSDGTATPLLTGQTATVPAFNSGRGAQGAYTATDLAPLSGTTEGTSYVLADQVGTTQMELSSGGWPVWQGWFTPFGGEIVNGATQQVLGNVPADGTDNRYKFTGKERDTESGPDYFGARYYASSMGRFMSPTTTMTTMIRNRFHTPIYSILRVSICTLM